MSSQTRRSHAVTYPNPNGYYRHQASCPSFRGLAIGRGREAHVALTKSGRPQMLLLDPLARSSGNAEAAGRWMRKRNHAGKKRNPAESARARARDSQGRQRRPGSRERCRVATERRRRARPLARFQTSSSRGACLAAGFLRA
jgi:hypothetical protein